jgi:hypothetical protein
MSTNRITEFDGKAGTQGSFLDDCWKLASPGHSGMLGKAIEERIGGTVSSLPEQSQVGQECNSAAQVDQTGQPSRLPDECERVDEAVAGALTGQMLPADWLTSSATKECGSTCSRFFTTALWHRSNGLDREPAERQAFGWLMTAILNLAHVGPGFLHKRELE